MAKKPSEEAMRRRGKLGRAASPWGRFPHCDTPNAIRAQAKYNKQKAIREAAEKLKKGKTDD